MTRRQWFAALFAPIVARFLPKSKPTEQLVVSLRFVRAFDPIAGEYMNRIDALYGYHKQFALEAFAAPPEIRAGDMITVRKPVRFLRDLEGVQYLNSPLSE